MKLTNIKYIATAAFAAIAVSAFAQETYSGYFVEGYEYRFRMNPAFGNDAEKAQNFVSFPGLANVNLGMRGNLHLTDIIYNVNGKTVLFTNPEVSDAEVMKNISDKNILGADMNLALLSAGFKAFGGYNTVSINARASMDVNIPRSLFQLSKEGISNEEYNVDGLSARAQAFAELALGHSRDLNSKWRIGGALKFYFGIANVDGYLDQGRLNLGADSWNIQSQANLHSSGIKLKSRYNSDTHVNDLAGFDMDGMGVNGFGIGLDLGGVFTLNEDWQFSAAVLDLGFISWSNDYLASTNGVKNFDTDKYAFEVGTSASENFDKIVDDLDTLLGLENMGDQGSRTTMMGVTLNFAARYTLPVYRKLSFGLVNSSRICGDYSWTDFRLSANIAPVKMLSASANLAVGSYGVGFGWLLNYHYTGFGLFVGMDHTLGKLSKQGIPLNSNASLNFGMNFLF